MGASTPAQQNPNIIIKEIKDQYIRKNFQNISDYFSNQNQLLNFKFFDQSFTGQNTNAKIAHGLGVVPEDIIVTQVTGKGRVTFNYGKFDSTNIDVSTDDDCRVRFFAGTYWGNTGGQNAADDAWTVGSLPQSTEANGGSIVFPYTEVNNSNGNSSGYAVQLSDSNIAFNPNQNKITTAPLATSLNAVLPLASDAKGKFYTFWKLPITGSTTQSPTCSVSVQQGSQDYINGAGQTTVQLQHMFEKYTFFSNGTYWLLTTCLSFQNAISTAKVPTATTVWHKISGDTNSLQLQPGLYLILANVSWGSNGTSPAYTAATWAFSSANGTDALVFPPQSWTGLSTFMMPTATVQAPVAAGFQEFGCFIFIVTAPVQVWLNTFATGTAANMVIQSSWGALKLA